MGTGGFWGLLEALELCWGGLGTLELYLEGTGVN